MFLEMLMSLVVELLDSSFFQGSIHMLDLAVGPGGLPDLLYQLLLV